MKDGWVADSSEINHAGISTCCYISWNRIKCCILRIILKGMIIYNFRKMILSKDLVYHIFKNAIFFKHLPTYNFTTEYG